SGLVTRCVMERAEPSIAESLTRAHAALLEDLRKLAEATRPPTSEELAELRARLGATRAHLAEHFRFEEQNGYMDVVRKREPRLERTIQQLAGEHRQPMSAGRSRLRVTKAVTRN